MSRLAVLSLSIFLSSAACGPPRVHRAEFDAAPVPGTGGRASGGASGGTGGAVVIDPPIGPPIVGPADAAVEAPAPTPSVDMNCGVATVELKNKPGNLLLVLDRSGSMVRTVSAAQPVERWGEVVAALDTVLMKTDAGIAWGLKLFPANGVCGVGDGVQVPLTAGNHKAIMTAIAMNRPMLNGGATPTRDAVRKATEFLKSHPEIKDPHLVVATDGEPNCVDPNGLGTTVDTDGAVTAIAEAMAAGIPSYVVGIATAGSGADAILNRMAEAGGRARTGVTKYYPVGSRDELAQAFGTITGEIASCTFPLTAAPPVPDNVAVEVGGRRTMQDPAQREGWHYGPNQQSIVLAGSVCDAVKASPNTTVQILFGCPNQPIR